MDEVKKCVECVLFETHKCTMRVQLSPSRVQPKIINTWEEWIEWLYDFSEEPPGTYKWTREKYPVFKTDIACADFIPFG